MVELVGEGAGAVTASPQRRQRRTITAITVSVLLVAVASAMFTVGVFTLSNSEEGAAVEVDERPRVALPVTPNAAMAVVDGDGLLASAVVMTLLPDGLGGSVVTVPVSSDTTAGFGEERVPLSEVFDPDDPEIFRSALESVLTLTIERVAIVDVDEFAELIAPIESVQVVLPEDVVDSNALGSGIIAQAGPQSLRRSLVAESLASVNSEGASYEHHDVDVALWTALATTAPVVVPPPPVPVDDLGRALPPETFEEFVARLWNGEVSVRDLAVYEPTPAENPTGADVVVIDRADAVLVFAQVSPALMSTPNPGLTVRIEVPFTDEQLAVTGEFETSSELARDLVAELLFFQANVVSVDTTPAPQGTSVVTEVEVAEERFLADTEDAAPVLYGPSNVEVASTVIEGVDVVVRLGTGYLEHEAGGPSGDDPEGLDTEELDPAGDSDATDPSQSIPDETSPGGSSPAETTTSDTVDGDA